MSLMSWLRNLLTPKPAPQKVELNRNDLCWCGSGKKYKKCHLPSDAANHREAKISAQFAELQRRQQGLVPGTPAGKKGSRPKPPEWKGGADAAKQ